MHRGNVIKISFLAVALATALPAFPFPSNDYSPWETVKKEIPGAKPIGKNSDVEILSTSGTIIVIASKPVHIKVFSILGRLIADNDIPAGTSRLPLSAHGVYIVTIGELTCKVAV